MESKHDNVDVRVTNRLNIYGNVSIIGGIIFAPVCFMFLGIYLTNYWAQAVTLAFVIVIGVASILGVVSLALAASLVMKVFVMPLIQLRREAQNNRLVHAQENAIVYIDRAGDFVVKELFAPVEVIDALPEPKVPSVDNSTIIALYDEGLSYRSIIERLKSTGVEVSYHQVQKVCSAYEAQKIKSR